MKKVIEVEVKILNQVNHTLFFLCGEINLLEYPKKGDFISFRYPKFKSNSINETGYCLPSLKVSNVIFIPIPTSEVSPVKVVIEDIVATDYAQFQKLIEYFKNGFEFVEVAL